MRSAMEWALQWSDDEAKTDMELVHLPCGWVECDAEDGDTMATLLGVMEEHRCPTPLEKAVHAADAAAVNDSNDGEIMALQNALEMALAALADAGVEVRR